LVTRDLSRTPTIPGAEIAQTSPAGYSDSASMTQAFRGAQTVFLVSGHFAPDRVEQHISAVDAALAAGVERIVYLSFLSAAPQASFIAAREHYATEQHIRSTGVPFTFLRSSLYADDAAGFFGADGIIRGPAGEGRVSWVVRDDIADAVTAVLTGDAQNDEKNDGHTDSHGEESDRHSRHDGQVYNNTGSEALTLTETAAVIAEFAGRPLIYHPETMEEAKQSRAV